jgi:hypothetical protein
MMGGNKKTKGDAFMLYWMKLRIIWLSYDGSLTSYAGAWHPKISGLLKIGSSQMELLIPRYDVNLSK